MATGLALVTGASSGIGLSLAKELAARGYDLVISSAGVRLDEASQELAETGVLVMPVRSDLATREGVDELLVPSRICGFDASAKTKLEGMLSNVVPGAVKAAMHEKMAEPIQDKAS